MGVGGSVWGLRAGVLPLTDRINLFFSILETFIFLKIDTVCLDSILIFYADSKNIMFYTEPWWVFFSILNSFLCPIIKLGNLTKSKRYCRELY